MRQILFVPAALLVTALLILFMVMLIRYDPPVAPVSEPVTRLSVAPVEREEPEPPVDAPPALLAPPDLASALQLPTGQMKVEPRRADLRPFERVTHGPIPLFAIEPVYPIEALEQAITGRVRVEFTINPDGTVSDAHVVEAEPRRGIFDSAALRALARAHFVPKKLNGVPVPSRAEWTFNFIEAPRTGADRGGVR